MQVVMSRKVKLIADKTIEEVQNDSFDLIALPVSALFHVSDNLADWFKNCTQVKVLAGRVHDLFSVKSSVCSKRSFHAIRKFWMPQHQTKAQVRCSIGCETQHSALLSIWGPLAFWSTQACVAMIDVCGRHYSWCCVVGWHAWSREIERFWATDQAFARATKSGPICDSDLCSPCCNPWSKGLPERHTCYCPPWLCRQAFWQKVSPWIYQLNMSRSAEQCFNVAGKSGTGLLSTL